MAEYTRAQRKRLEENAVQELDAGHGSAQLCAQIALSRHAMDNGFDVDRCGTPLTWYCKVGRGLLSARQVHWEHLE